MNKLTKMSLIVLIDRKLEPLRVTKTELQKMNKGSNLNDEIPPIMWWQGMAC